MKGNYSRSRESEEYSYGGKNSNRVMNASEEEIIGCLPPPWTFGCCRIDVLWKSNRQFCLYLMAIIVYERRLMYYDHGFNNREFGPL